MRPTRLELRGFTSFRDETVVDFEGADYFALVGPTGAGKSTIIDAICFALYGSVPRYEDRRLVAPVISSGQLEAKVRLDFDLGKDSYTAVRVVKRSAKGTGASTKEARLEKNGETVAGNADELSAAVARLLGLSFEHFTRCVVLPQGEFARFLHDDPKDRQDLLVKLLNLGIYDRMRQEANKRASELKYEGQILQERLDRELSFATDEALKLAGASATKLEALRGKIAEADPQLQSLAKDVQRAEEEADDLRSWIERIEGLSMPKDVSSLASRLGGLRKDLAAADKALTGATAAVGRARKALESLPDRDPLAAAAKAHERLGSVRKRLDSAEQILKDVSAETHARAKAAAEADETARLAEEEVQRARAANIAAHLAAGLSKGDDCPVCFRAIGTVPKHPGRDGVAAAEKAHAKALGAAKKAAVLAREWEAKLAGADSTVTGLTEQLREIEVETAEHPDPKKVVSGLEKIAIAEEALETARNDEDAIREARSAAQQKVDDAKAQEDAARVAFERARDSLVPLEPPPTSHKDLEVDWQQLLTWSKDRMKSLLAELKAADGTAARARSKLDALNSALRISCAECEVEVGRGSMLEAVVTAHTNALHEKDRIATGIAEAAEARTRAKAVALEQKTNHQLAQHLSAGTGMFESWLVNSALARLVVAAGKILSDLSDDQYSLSLDDKSNFQVVDRNNANETRSARTLSGGETFLASLALALALADQLADLAVEGAAHLDAIFLDEGFGTLDPETLRTVGDTVEKLASEGRMVGIVTHVRELADSVPLQFRVRKEAGSSTVERIPA
jgi:exonuclease SbcC